MLINITITVQWNAERYWYFVDGWRWGRLPRAEAGRSHIFGALVAATIIAYLPTSSSSSSVI